MCSESTATVEFPFLRLHNAPLKRPIVWIFIQNPHDEKNPGFRFPALIDTGADRSIVPYRLCRILGHAFEAGLSPSRAGGIGKGRIRTFSHSARIAILSTPDTGRAPSHAEPAFAPVEMRLGFVEQDLPFALLGQADFLQYFDFRQIRAEWKFTLRKL